MPNIYFTADHHFNHHNIIKYTNRPYQNVNEMRKEFIKNHNLVVENDEDEVYFIGDLTLDNHRPSKLKRIMNKMNGVKHLVLGNHDKYKPFTYHEMGLESDHTMLDLSHLLEGNKKLKLTHDPANSIMDTNTIWLCGHVHTLFRIQKNAINCGLDVWNYKPVILSEIRNLAASRNLL